MENKIIIDMYSDGTYDKYTNKATWGFVITKDGKEIFKNKGEVLDKESLSGWQIAAELQAVIEGIKYCKLNNYSCRIFYDYNGVYNWVKDYFVSGKPWKTKTKYTKSYREFISQNLQFIKSYHWVKSHSGNTFNELVDGFISKK